ncbi:helix-turn-helix domain-containing protein [Schumannella luteola]|uniref:DNA-binding transcriptional ArsR family regulator n=1 Tax=Schumannella luteola TaxID=472059 RepID=A0A852YGI4_9MICO|nr:helix-turn-helix domain-containing protein [Schumannella luteola]NYH00401.1 DNA-binding transcriptional ArsR family regulator [Schumannella luteola]TPX03685.1 helix-turn-helix domain-containing protein [Schumannella luteola]
MTSTDPVAAPDPAHDAGAHAAFGRTLDATALKAYAHPLRVAIVDALSTFGPATASGLGDRLGESSGSTSYHLRQLEKHGFVREVEGRGTARERWWERVPGGISLDPSAFRAGGGMRAASELIQAEWEHRRRRQLDEFLAHGDELGEKWIDRATISTANLRLTGPQLAKLSKRLMEVVDEFVVTYRDSTEPGSRPVQAQLNVFPVMGGDVTPGDEAGEDAADGDAASGSTTASKHDRKEG